MIEDSFHLTENDFRQFLELTPDGIVAIQAGKLVYANPAFLLEMGATSASSYIGRGLLEVTAEEDHEWMKQVLQDRDPQLQRKLQEIHFIRQDGSKAICEFAGRRVGDRSDPTGLYVVRDVSADRQQLEELRQASEERNLMFEGGPIGVTLTDTEGRYLHANRAVCKLLGYSEAELRELTYLDLTLPADRLPEVRALRTLWTGTPEIRVEKRFLRRDNELIQVAAHITLLRDAQGEPRGYVTHLVDRTAELKAAAAILNAEEQFRALFSGSQIATGLLMLGEQTFFSRVNEAMCALFGYSEQEMLTIALESLLDPVDLPSSVARMKLAELHLGKQYKQVVRYLGKDQRPFFGERFVSIVPDENGKPGAAVVQVIDVTARVLAEQALAKSLELHKLVLKNLPRVAMLVYDLELRYTQVEGAGMFEALNMDAGQFVGRLAREVAEPAAVERIEQNYTAGIYGPMVTWLHSRGGHVYDCHSTALRDERGRVVGGMTLIYDKTP